MTEGPVFYPDLRRRRPVYLSGADNPALRKLDAPADVGLLAQPASYHPAATVSYRTWALDYGCYSAGTGFDPARWVRWVATFDDPGLRWGNWRDDYESRLLTPDDGPMPACGCLFAAAPDVPFDAKATWSASQPWLAVIRRLGFPAALVAQNGVEDQPQPWDEIDAWDCLFLRGTTAWKESQEAADCARYARLSGKWVHAGRVNSRRRLRRLAGHVDSVDGTFLAYGPDRNIARLTAWLDELANHRSLL